MRKILSLMLIGMIVSLCLVGCGKKAEHPGGEHADADHPKADHPDHPK